MKQLQQLMRTCNHIFPHATVYIAQIHFSDRLTLRTQLLLQDFNERIKKKYTFLPTISPLDFRVEAQDPINWEPRTGEKILTSWLKKLNLNGGKCVSQPLP